MKKIMIVVLCAALSIFGFAACSSAPVQNTQTQQQEQTQEQKTQEKDTQQASDEAADSVFGQITAIEGNQATIALGTMSRGEGSPDMQDADRPEKPEDGQQSAKSDTQAAASVKSAANDDASKEDTSEDTAKKTDRGASSKDNAAAEDGQQDAAQDNKPSGEAPEGGKGGFTADASGTQITVDLSAVTIETRGADNEDASAVDLAVGDIVKMEGSGEGSSFVPTKLTLLGGKPDGMQGGEAPEAPANQDGLFENNGEKGESQNSDSNNSGKESDSSAKNGRDSSKSNNGSSEASAA
ncbi:MAG: hypothetical protein VB082_03200 [Christensenella sp.]|nr:hypothetical protein [Christensenella sp.]